MVSLTDRDFVAGSRAWRVSRARGASRLRVRRGGAARGQLVWVDFPDSLEPETAYELRISWSPRTAASTINLHIRNPASGKFRVIGRAVGANTAAESREDTVRFRVSEPGFSQFMLGASQFTGHRAGADVTSLEIERIPGDDPRARSAGAPTSPNAGRFRSAAKSLALADYERQARSNTHADTPESTAGARARVMFHAHAVEKGLSRSNSRAGFGKVAVPSLAKEMNAWLADGRSLEDDFIQSAAAVMHQYFERNEFLHADVSHYRALFSEAVLGLIDAYAHAEGGTVSAAQVRERPPESHDRGFIDVVYGRRSIREFTDATVADEDIEHAVQIAMQAPSVCNRQGARVHQFEDPRIVKLLVDLQGGFGGYEMPPRLLLVTADLDAFLFAAERNQPYVDGGLFMMSLLLGLTQVGLGSCSLNTAMGSEKDTKIRDIIRLPDNEVMIAFIAVGHFDDSVLVPRSKRTSTDQILIRHRRN